jgi:hypothetical protein
VSEEVVYCIDSSSLINAWGDYYRPRNFPSFWANLERLITVGRCVTCEEVREELDSGSDELKEWVRKQGGFVVSYDHCQEQVVQDIMNTFPNIINLKKNRGWADPFVIALAKCRGYVVVTEEKLGEENAPRIPFVCRKLGVRPIDLSDLIAAEDWKI